MAFSQSRLFCYANSEQVKFVLLIPTALSFYFHSNGLKSGSWSHPEMAIFSEEGNPKNEWPPAGEPFHLQEVGRKWVIRMILYPLHVVTLQYPHNNNPFYQSPNQPHHDFPTFLPPRPNRPRHRRNPRNRPSRCNSTSWSRRQYTPRPSTTSTIVIPIWKKSSYKNKQRDESSKTTCEAVLALGRKATIYIADLSSPESVKALTPRIFIDGHRVDILVNCAGIQKRHPSHMFPDADWNEVLSIYR